MWSFEISVLHSCGHFPFIHSCNRLMLAILAKTYRWQNDRQIKLLCFGLDKLYHNSGYYTKWAIHAPKWHIQTTNVGHTRVDTYMWTNFRHSHTFSRYQNSICGELKQAYNVGFCRWCPALRCWFDLKDKNDPQIYD